LLPPFSGSFGVDDGDVSLYIVLAAAPFTDRGDVLGPTGNP
jgi:hypothetical protein